jgi:hypothetical protein
MNDVVLDSDSSMPMTLYFAICEYSCPEIVFASLPRRPPDGMLTAFIISSFIGIIFTVMPVRSCFKLSSYSLRNFLVAEIKAAVRYTDRPIYSGTTQNHTIMADNNLWHDGFRGFISSIVFLLLRLPTMMPTTISRLHQAIVSQAHIFSFKTRILPRITAFSCRSMLQRISRIMRESVYFLRESLKYFRKINHCDPINTLMGFTTFAFSTLAASVHEKTMASYDTVSSFWVCDNSATGHICNDKNLFTGDLVPSMYIVGAATGTSEPTLMGTVELRITDDDEEKHKFTLTHVNYMPASSVNLLSTQALSKQFTNANGINSHGTGIHSCYKDHTLIWDHGKYRKTFKTHDSGLP